MYLKAVIFFLSLVNFFGQAGLAKEVDEGIALWSNLFDYKMKLVACHNEFQYLETSAREAWIIWVIIGQKHFWVAMDIKNKKQSQWKQDLQMLFGAEAPQKQEVA